MIFSKNKALNFRFLIWYSLANTLLFWFIGFPYLQSSFLSQTLFSNAAISYSGGLEKSYIIVFIILNYLSYFMFLAFLPAIPLFVFNWFFPFKFLIVSLALVFASLSISLFLIDNFVFYLYKFHLNLDLLGLLLQDAFSFLDLSLNEFLLSIGVVILVVSLELFLIFILWKKINLLKNFPIVKILALVWGFSFGFSYCILVMSIGSNLKIFSQKTVDLPFYNQIISYLIPTKNARFILNRFSETDNYQAFFPHDKMHYPLHAMNCQKPFKPYNLILIMIDSLRFDSLQKAYMPNLTHFADESWQFQNHLSGGNSTQPGLFSLFFSIPPNYWTAALEQKVPAVLTQLLLNYGYSMQIFWSAAVNRPAFHKTIFTGINDLSLEGSSKVNLGDKDRDITEKALNFLSKNPQSSPFFLFLFYDAVHGFCRQQNFAKPFQPALNRCLRSTITNKTDPIPYYNRYLNAVKFDDEQIAKVLTAIKEKGYLDNSIIIFTSDHGQEFNDNKLNYWGHTSNYTRAQIQVPLIVHWPKESPRILHYQTSSYDLVPTLFERAFGCKNPKSDYSIGQDLLNKENRLPFLLAGSYVNLGVIEKDRLTTLQSSGDILITNKNAEPLPFAKLRGEILSQAYALMRKYYERAR